ncbi:MAG TPA: hypothetical protein VGM39_17705 [Kofleriaceae bacterium]
MKVLRLAALVLCVGLATSRLGLLAHELVGHGGAATLMGGHVTMVRLFWFAGGWVRYENLTHGRLFVSMGGIGLEIVIGGLLLLLLMRRARSFAVVIGRCVGAALVIHPAWYLATGAFLGYGDGAGLHDLLGSASVAVWLPAALLAISAAFFASRMAVGAFTQVAGGRAFVVLALVVGLGAQLAASQIELRVRRDESYTAMMTHANKRDAFREYAAWLAQQKQRGAVPEDVQRAQLQKTLDNAPPEFPFAYVLGALLGIAVLAGALMTRPAPDAVLTSRLLAAAAATALGSIALVIAIGALLS